MELFIHNKIYKAFITLFGFVKIYKNQTKKIPEKNSKELGRDIKSYGTPVSQFLPLNS